jgi:hypothetical protein
MKEKVVIPKISMEELDNIFKMNRFERAFVLRRYMDTYLLTINQLANRLNIKKSILSDWLKWNNIMETEYEIMVDSGFNDDKIQTIIKLKNDNKGILEDYFIIQSKSITNTINSIKKNINTHQETIDSAQRLRNELNYFLYKIEKNNKK